MSSGARQERFRVGSYFAMPEKPDFAKRDQPDSGGTAKFCVMTPSNTEGEPAAAVSDANDIDSYIPFVMGKGKRCGRPVGIEMGEVEPDVIVITVEYNANGVYIQADHGSKVECKPKRLANFVFELTQNRRCQLMGSNKQGERTILSQSAGEQAVKQLRDLVEQCFPDDARAQPP